MWRIIQFFLNTSILASSQRTQGGKGAKTINPQNFGDIQQATVYQSQLPHCKMKQTKTTKQCVYPPMGLLLKAKHQEDVQMLCILKVNIWSYLSLQKRSCTQIRSCSTNFASRMRPASSFAYWMPRKATLISRSNTGIVKTTRSPDMHNQIYPC